VPGLIWWKSMGSRNLNSAKPF